MNSGDNRRVVLVDANDRTAAVAGAGVDLVINASRLQARDHAVILIEVFALIGDAIYGFWITNDIDAIILGSS